MSPSETSALSKSKTDSTLRLHNVTPVFNSQDSASISQKSNQRTGNFTKLYFLSDILALFIGFAAVWLLSNSFHAVSYSIIAVGVLFFFERGGHYKVRTPFWQETQKIISVLAVAMLVDNFVQFTPSLDITKFLIVASWAVVAVSVIGFRAIVRSTSATQGSFQIPVLLVGGGSTASKAQAAMESAPEMGYKIVGQIKNLPEVFIHAGASWADLCEEYGAKHVVIALDGKDLLGSEKILTKLTREAISFSMVSPYQTLPVTGMAQQYFMNHNTMFYTRNAALDQNLPNIAKRTIDITVSGVALALLSPIMLIIAAMIKMDGGDAFFGHKRLGKDGKVFPCLKFRSMIMGGDKVLKKHLEENPEAAAEWKATQKLQNDPRITKVGKFLRSTSLDELPQLINVLKGDMSLVGPRPIVRDEVAHYSQDIDYYYMVRPGVTGLWQVSGRSDVSYAQRVQMDSWYVRNWSLWNDIAILLKTFPAVLKRSGAY